MENLINHAPVHVGPDTHPVLELDDVHRRYGSLEVLRGLSLTVQQGEVFGFLGRNGAGKSTAIRIMMGITRADRGQLRLFGQPLKDSSVKLRQRIGYVAQEQNFYRWMSPKRLGKFVSGFYPRWDSHRYLRLIEDFGLPAGRQIGAFSGGMKAKLALSVALATSPELLILDEPTAGMDPVGRREFLNLVRSEALQTGATIFFSTHLIDDIGTVADRINIINHGKTLYEGSLDPLRESVRSYSIDLTAANLHYGPVEGRAGAQIQSVDTGGRRTVILQFPFDTPVNAFVNPGWQREPMTLEDAFVALVTASGA